MATRAPLTSGRPGTVPGLTYEYVPADDDTEAHHYLKCRCRWFVKASSPVAARRAGQSHITEHLTRLVNDPEPDLD